MSLIGPTEVRYIIATIAAITIIVSLPIGYRLAKRPSATIKVEATGFVTRHLAHLLMMIHLILSLIIFFDSSALSFLPGGFILEQTVTTSIITYAGLLFWLLGNIIRIWGIYSQGEMFEKEVRIRDDHHLLTGGPYQLSRHPVYLGNLLAELGLGVALLSWPLVVWTLLFSFPAWNSRATTEEKLLHDHFGINYKKYCQKVGRWSPF